MANNVELISEAVAIAGSQNPDDTAFVLDSGQKISFRALNRQISDLTQLLLDLGAQPQDRIAFASPRNYFGIAGFIGIAGAAVCCPVNPGLPAHELGRFFRSLSIAALVAPIHATEAIKAANEAGLALIAIEVDDGIRSIPPDRAIGIGDRLSEGRERHALLMQTSGTTSAPKIVLLSHDNILASARGIVREFSIGPKDICLNPMPLHHVHGLISAGISSLLGASSAICLPSFSPRLFASLYDELDPTWFTGSPAMHIALLEHYRRIERLPVNTRLRFLRSSSAPLPASVIADLEQLFEAPLIETYGLTETASMITTNPLPPKTRKVGSVGLPNIGELRVLTDNDEVAAPNVEGEIVVRGPSTITSYANLGADNDRFFVHGWLRTGDLGRLDEDGYCFVTGRKKELIKRGGLSVYPSEIDNLLMIDDRVTEAVTFSIPHPTLGEEVVSAIVPAAGARVEGDELRDRLFDILPTYKVPARILTLKAIPKNESGKVLRRNLPAQLSHLLAPRNDPPRDVPEQKLLVIWRDVLRRHDIGVTDNLFILGADPSRSRVVEELIKGAAMASRLTVADLFRAPTIRQQAALLRERASAND
jgi:oxalate---CoA ligase